MKLIALGFILFICYSALAQGSSSRIRENIGKQYVYTEQFSFPKNILNYQAEESFNNLTIKNSPFGLTLTMAETTDLNIICRRKKYELGVSVEDFFNMDWNKAQLSLLSRLKDEPAPVEEIDPGSGISFLFRVKFSISL